MSFLVPFLTAPAGYLIKTYQEANFDLPLQKQSLFFAETVKKGDPEYDQLVKSLPGSHIKAKIQPFLDQVKLSDVVVAEAPNLGFCSAKGFNNSNNKSSRVILIAPGFYEADKDACTWVAKHEIAHIKNSDLITINLSGGICSTAAAIYAAFYMAFIPAMIFTNLIGMVGVSLYSQRREAAADDFAIANSSNEELLGGRRFLITTQRASLAGRVTFYDKMAKSSSGDNRLDIFHPSLTSRIQKIEKVLAKRSVSIDSSVENQKIEALESFMKGKITEIKEMIKQAGGFWGILKLQAQN